MTIQRFPSAIYRCDLPVSSAGAIYSSSVNTRERRRTHSSHPPIPAWPDIKSTDQWCCLPGLWRAIFTYGKDQDLDYGPQLQYLLNLSHKYGQEVVNEAIKFYQLPPSDRRNASNAVIYLSWSAQWWDLAQGGQGFNGAFSCQHEVGHRLVGAQGVYSSILQAACEC
jgi:hypothetical protein